MQAVGGATYSYVHLFWDSSKGENCAVNVKVGSLYGVQSWTTVQISECSETSPGNLCTSIDSPPPDSGDYYEYAGPVSVPAVGHCIKLYAHYSVDGSQAWLNTGAFHCG